MKVPMLKVDSNVLAQEVDGELVLLHLGTENYFGLNRVGAEIWEEIKRHGELDEVCAALIARYADVESNTVRRDVEELVQQLLERQILREAE